MNESALQKNPTDDFPEHIMKMELQAEAELKKVQRQQRLFEKSYLTDLSGTKFRKQQSIFECLKKEKYSIIKDLAIATVSAKKKQDALMFASLNNLLEDKENYDSQVMKKKSKLNDIIQQIDFAQKRSAEIRNKLPTAVYYQNRVFAGRKTLETLENKLEYVTKKFCILTLKNSELRVKIEHLLIERIEFNKLWQKLILNLNKGKHYMLDLIEQATLAYNQRDEWCTRLKIVRARAYTDLLQNTQEMNYLQRKLNKDIKMDDFFSKKSQKRSLCLLQDKMNRKAAEKQDEIKCKLKKHTNLLSTIKEFIGHDNINNIIYEYNKRQHFNFQKFSLVLSSNGELEALTHYVVDLHKNINIEIKLNNMYGQRQIDNLKNLNTDIITLNQEVNEIQSIINKNNKLLSKFYEGIEKLFKICKCNKTPLLELLGTTKINDFNVELYLTTLEKSIIHLIMRVYFKQKEETKKQKTEPIIKEYSLTYPLMSINQIVPTNPCSLCVDNIQVHDVMDTLQFVQNRDEVETKLRQRLVHEDISDRLHNVSACHLSKSRNILLKKFQ